MKRRIVTLLLIATLCAAYVLYSVLSLLSQPDAVYVRRSEIMSVFENNREYFEQVAEFYRLHDKQYIFYDSDAQSYLENAAPDTDEEAEIIEKLLDEFSFNEILRGEHGALSIDYARPLGHSVRIGMKYDYNSEKWRFLYSHNHTTCEYGHLTYWIFDLICNRANW